MCHTGCYFTPNKWSYEQNTLASKKPVILEDFPTFLGIPKPTSPKPTQRCPLETLDTTQNTQQRVRRRLGKGRQAIFQFLLLTGRRFIGLDPSIRVVVDGSWGPSRLGGVVLDGKPGEAPRKIEKHDDIYMYIYTQCVYPLFSGCQLWNNTCLAILCDLFGMVNFRDPFKWLESWPPTIADEKITSESPGSRLFTKGEKLLRRNVNLRARNWLVFWSIVLFICLSQDVSLIFVEGEL